MHEDSPISPIKRKRSLLPQAAFLFLFALLYGFGRLDLWGAVFGIAASFVLLAIIDKQQKRLFDRLTDALRASRAPRRTHTLLRAMMVDGIEEPLLLISPDRVIVDANTAAKTLLGTRIIGRDVSLHIRHPDILDALSAILNEPQSRRIEVTVAGPVERVFFVVLSRVYETAAGEDAHRTATPDPTGYFIVLSMHDISQMKKIERMRADFVANASHELRTPLSSLIGFLETLSGPAKDDKEAQSRFLAIMHEEALRMVRLIDDLLSLSRIELDKHLQPQQSANIPALLSSVIRSLDPVAAGRDMTISLVIPDDLPLIQGDSDQLRQVMQNLLSNAIKYADKGSTITVKCTAPARIAETGEEGVAISVMDEGAGIAPEHIPRLTERFYRIDAARSRQMGGTGLGLAIVKHIVTRHRGHLDIASKLGHGTTVTVTLPAFHKADDAEKGNGA